jgi:4-amino-4-deoxy-L-arabinose transferase-like glycosyltransferase
VRCLSDELRRHRYACHASVAVALAVLLVGLNVPLLHSPHFWDSLTFVAGAHYILANEFSPILPPTEDYGHPVLLLEAVALAWRVFGESLYVAHALMLVFAFVALYATYLLGAHLYGWQTGAVAALLLMLYPLFRTQSSLVLLDMPVAAFTALAALFLVRNNVLGFALTASAMVLTKASGIVLVPAALVYVLLTYRKHRSWCWLTTWVVACLVVVAVLASWFVFHGRVTGWISAEDNLGWLDLPEGMGLGRMLTSYLPRMLFGQGGVLGSFVYLALGYFVARFFVGLVTLCILLYSVTSLGSRSPTGVRVDRGSLARMFEPQRLAPAWGGWENIALLAGPIVLQLGAMSLTVSMHRYLLPEYTLFFVAGAKAFTSLLRRTSLIVTLAGVTVVFLLSWADPRAGGGMLVSPSTATYLDFVEVDRAASAFLQEHYADARILADWPQYMELAMPEQGYVRKPLRLVVPVGTLPRQAARVTALGQQLITNPVTLTTHDFDVVYYSARAYPPQEQLRAVIERLQLTVVAEFSRNADYVAIYAPAKQYDARNTWGSRDASQ